MHGWCDGGVNVQTGTSSAHGVSQALTALKLVALLAVRGRWDADVYYVVTRRVVVRRSVRYLFLRHDAVNFWRKKQKHNARFNSVTSKG